MKSLKHCFEVIWVRNSIFRRVIIRRDPILSILGRKQDPKSFDILINQRSSYICISEIVEIVVPIYYFIQTLIFQKFGHYEWLYALGFTNVHTFTSSFVWSMTSLIIWQICTCHLIFSSVIL